MLLRIKVRSGKPVFLWVVEQFKTKRLGARHTHWPGKASDLANAYLTRAYRQDW